MLQNAGLYMNTIPLLRILLADDHVFVREALAALLSRESDMCVVAEAADGQEAIDLFRLHLPCVALMDLRMPQVNGLQAIQAICAEFPAAFILLFTTYADNNEIAAALNAGAKGWLLKDAPAAELLAALRLAPRTLQDSYAV